MNTMFNYRFNNKNQETVNPLSIINKSGKKNEKHKIKPLS